MIRRATRAGVACLLLLVIYVGTYYFIVRLEPPGGGTGAPPWPRHAVYPMLQETSQVVFAPIERLDERLRPRAWQYWGIASECADAYEYLLNREDWPDELQPDVERLYDAIDATWFVDDEVDEARRAVKSGDANESILEQALNARKARVDRALKEYDRFRARVAEMSMDARR